MAIIQRNATRNQSTADYSGKCIFLFDNRFREEVLTVAGETTVEEGMLVMRSADKIVPLDAVANIANVVGILKAEQPITAGSTDEDFNVNIATKGTIDETGLVLPNGVTLNTVQDGITVRDHLERLGFHMEYTVEHTDFEE